MKYFGMFQIKIPPGKGNHAFHKYGFIDFIDEESTAAVIEDDELQFKGKTRRQLEVDYGTLRKNDRGERMRRTLATPCGGIIVKWGETAPSNRDLRVYFR